MGGRGGSSGIGGSGGFDVTKDGQTTRYYFSSKNGMNYYQRGIGGTPEPTPLNMSASEFRRRVTSGGASVKNVSASERAKESKAYKADRKATNRQLDLYDTSNKEMRKGSRSASINNRANKRLRRR